MSDLLGKLRSGAEKIAKEADKTAHITRIEWQIRSLRKQVDEQYQQLGQLTYDSHVQQEPENPDAAAIIGKITELKQLIDAKEEEIQDIREDRVVPQTASLDTQFCTNCGRASDAASKFCSECGSPLDG